MKFLFVINSINIMMNSTFIGEKCKFIRHSELKENVMIHAEFEGNEVLKN